MMKNRVRVPAGCGNDLSGIGDGRVRSFTNAESRRGRSFRRDCPECSGCLRPLRMIMARHLAFGEVADTFHRRETRRAGFPETCVRWGQFVPDEVGTRSRVLAVLAPVPTRAASSAECRL